MQREFEVTGKKTVTIVAIDRREAARLFRQMTGCEPETVGDEEILGFDEGTGDAVFEYDDFRRDGDGCYLLREHHG